MFTGTLLPYQEEAVERMVSTRKILVAYDLGLGKTVITLAACERLMEDDPLAGPVLVVALASLKYQWAKEVGKFTNSRALVIDGTKAQRQKQILESPGYDYLITNYETVVNDWDEIAFLNFNTIVIDEATAIKSFRSKRSRRVKELARSVDTRFALTGTPIENGRPEEIFSIMQAVDGRLLGRFDHFDATFIVRNYFGGVDRYRNLDRLHDRLSRNLIRKTQNDPDVAPYMPDSIHRDPEIVKMDKKVRPLYRETAFQLMEGLEEAIGAFGSGWSLSSHYGFNAPNAPGTEEMGRLMGKVTLLRQLCSHPELVIESADKFEANYRQALDSDEAMRGGGSLTAWELLQEDGVREILASAKVPKLELLDRIVKDHLATDDSAKVVVFTSFLTTADLIHDRLGGVTYSGKMNAKEKESAKVQFQTDPETRVLVSTDAGGYGVDLPQANLLINYDLPWSAGAAVQRNGRIKRASSRWPTVVIQDLLVEDSIEIRQYDLLNQKTAVASAVVDGRGINDKGGIDFSAGSLLEHLKVTVGALV